MRTEGDESLEEDACHLFLQPDARSMIEKVKNETAEVTSV